jgi:hypothetical protein
MKRKWTFALLLALGIAVSVFPLGECTNDQIASSYNAKIGLNEDKIVKVDAKATLVTLKKSKIKKSKKYKKSKKTVKKVKAASKKVKVKVRYKYKGKWRYKWVYKYYTPSTPKIQQAPVTNANSGNSGTYSATVSADAKCSCSLYTDYNVHKGTYVNYCPFCQKYGTLTYTNQQGCPEGMFYCDMCKGGCDADFCIVHGKVHTNTNVKFLTNA